MTAPVVCQCHRLELQDCPSSRALLRALRSIYRKQTGLKTFRHEHSALAWFFTTREAWGSARALPITAADEGGGTPSKGADSPGRMAFASVGYAIKLAEDAAKENGDKAPIGAWLLEHHGPLGRSAERISEHTNCHWTTDQVRRRLEKAHHVIRRRLIERGYIEGHE